MTSPYTLKNLADVDDSAVKFGVRGLQEVRFATGDLEAEGTGVSHHRVKPGKRQGFAHRTTRPRRSTSSSRARVG